MDRWLGAMVWLHLLVALAAAQPARAADPDPSSKSNPAFDAALNDFRANRIRESARATKAILSKDPKNKEAAMLLATMYYQNHKLKKAQYWFDRGDASLLTNDTAFAWGSTYLEFDDDKKAALGFRYILKNKGPFRPFAFYYMGVIYYKSAQWLRARKFLQKVNPDDLPVALRVNRRRYLADIKRQQDKMLESIIGMNDKQSTDIGSAPPVDEKERTVGTKDGQDDDLDAPKPETRQVPLPETAKAWRFSFKPAVALTQQNLYFDNHGLNHDSANLIVHREGVAGIANYGDERSGATGLLGGLEFNLGNIAYSARLDQTQFFTIDQTSGIFTSQVSRNQDEGSGFIVAKPHLNWYLNERFRIELGVGVRAYFPDYNYLVAWGQGSEHLGLRYENSDTELGLEFAILQPFDEKQKTDALDLSGKGEIERQLGDVRVTLQAYGWSTDRAGFLSADRFRLILADSQLRYRTGFESEVGGAGSLLFNLFSETALQLRLESLSRQAAPGKTVQRLTATESLEASAYGANKGLVSLNIPLWDSASITGSAAYHLLSDYHSQDVGTDGTLIQEFVTDVEQTIFQGGGMISFADWIRLSAAYTVTSNNFIETSAAERAFRRRNPDYIADSAIFLEVAKSF